MMKEWNAPIYAFFKPIPKIEEGKGGRHCHVFECFAASCKGRGQEPWLIRRYLDTGDRNSTGNLHKHAKACWGDETIQKADNMKNLEQARKEVAKARHTNDSGSITAMFSRIEGKGNISYSHCQHTPAEAQFMYCIH
jgi:hypothetical protein